MVQALQTHGHANRHANHHDLWIVGKRIFSALRWYFVRENRLIIEVTAAVCKLTANNEQQSEFRMGHESLRITSNKFQSGSIITENCTKEFQSSSQITKNGPKKFHSASQITKNRQELPKTFSEWFTNH